jgi:hypothetical protein
MIRWAALNSSDLHPMDYTDYRPADNDDLGRCERAYDAAPYWLQRRMLPLLVTFRTEVAKQEAQWQAGRLRHAAEEAVHTEETRARAIVAMTSGREITLELGLTEARILQYLLAGSIDSMYDDLFTTGEDDEVCSLGYTYDELNQAESRITQQLAPQLAV